MRLVVLTPLTAALFASGSTLAMAQATEDPGATAKEQLQHTQPQADVKGAQTGEYTEPTEEKIVKESDVEGAQSEEMMGKGEPASITQ